MDRAPERGAAVSPASVEGFATPAPGLANGARKPRQSSQPPLPATPAPAPAHPAANYDGTHQGAVDSATVTEAAQSAPKPPAASVSDASEEEQTNTA